METKRGKSLLIKLSSRTATDIANHHRISGTHEDSSLLQILVAFVLVGRSWRIKTRHQPAASVESGGRRHGRGGHAPVGQEEVEYESTDSSKYLVNVHTCIAMGFSLVQPADVCSSHALGLG